MFCIDFVCPVVGVFVGVDTVTGELVDGLDVVGFDVVGVDTVTGEFVIGARSLLIGSHHRRSRHLLVHRSVNASRFNRRISSG